MKTITCDLCKKHIGNTIQTGIYTSINTTQYNPRGFGDHILYEQNPEVDVCVKCSNKILDAQNEAIKKIRESL